MVSLPLIILFLLPCLFPAAPFGAAPLVRAIVQALSLSSAAALWPTVETPFLAGASEAAAGGEHRWILIRVGLALGL